MNKYKVVAGDQPDLWWVQFNGLDVACCMRRGDAELIAKLLTDHKHRTSEEFIEEYELAQHVMEVLEHPTWGAESIIDSIRSFMKGYGRETG